MGRARHRLRPLAASEALTGMHELTKQEARRIAVRAQLLAAPRPTDLLAVVQQLTLLQIDPTAAIAPSADLVAWSRLGSSYDRGQLQLTLEKDRTLFEHNALIRPMGDLGLVLAGAGERPAHPRTRDWLRANDRFRRDILERLGDAGPLPSREIPDTCVAPWESSGWTHDKNVTRMLEVLMSRCEVAVSGRIGRERLWDLPERVYPADVSVPSVDEAERIRNERRLASLGIARRMTTKLPIEPVDVGDAGEPAVVEGVKGEWRVEPSLLDGDFEGRTALSRRSTASSTTAGARRRSSSSSTRSRCTSRPRSAAGATSRSRSSTATGSSARSTPPPTTRRRCSACTPSTRT